MIVPRPSKYHPKTVKVLATPANPSACRRLRRRQLRSSKKNCVLWDKMHMFMIMAFILQPVRGMLQQQQQQQQQQHHHHHHHQH